MRCAAAALAAGALLVACSGDEGVDPSAVTTSSVSTSDTMAPAFEGDPDSTFCQLSRAEPVEALDDPFEAGLEPIDVQIRLDAVLDRLGSLSGVAPEEIAADLDLLHAGVGLLDAALADLDYDLVAAVDSGLDPKLFDDPAHAAAGARVAAYQDQVCLAE